MSGSMNCFASRTRRCHSRSGQQARLLSSHSRRRQPRRRQRTCLSWRPSSFSRHRMLRPSPAVHHRGKPLRFRGVRAAAAQRTDAAYGRKRYLVGEHKLMSVQHPSRASRMASHQLTLRIAIGSGRSPGDARGSARYEAEPERSIVTGVDHELRGSRPASPSPSFSIGGSGQTVIRTCGNRSAAERDRWRRNKRSN